MARFLWRASYRSESCLVVEKKSTKSYTRQSKLSQYMVYDCTSMEFPSTSMEASFNFHRRHSTSMEASINFHGSHLPPWNGRWWKEAEAAMEADGSSFIYCHGNFRLLLFASICFHGSISTSIYSHGSTTSVYFRGGFQILPSASI